MRLLFLTQPGTNSRSIMLDIAAGAQAAGHEVLTLELGPIWQMAQRTGDQQQAAQGDLNQLLAAFIQHNRIDVTVAMWANAISTLGLMNDNGKAVTLFDAIARPHLMIWLDTPERAQDGAVVPLFATGALRSPWLFHFVNNAGSAAEMTGLFGFNEKTVLPSRYGINPDIFKPLEGVERQFDIMYSAGGADRWATEPTATMLEEVAKDEPNVDRIRAELAAGVRERLDEFCQPFGAQVRQGVRQVMEAMVDMQITERDAPVIDRFVKLSRQHENLVPPIDALLNQHNAYVPFVQAMRSIENFQRAFTFVWLSKRFRCGMFGKVDYSAWGCGVRSLGFVDYAKQAEAYNRAKLGLSVMRWQDEVGVHIKPMEITASGTACLAGWRGGIHDLYEEDREIVTFRNLPEAAQKARSLLDDDAKLSALAEAGRARTLRDHTWAKVMNGLLATIQQRMPTPA